MCDCRNDYCYCDEERVQRHNGLQSCHSFELVPPTPKLNPINFQQKRDNRIRIKNTLHKKETRSRSSSLTLEKPQIRRNGGRSTNFDRKNNKKSNRKFKQSLNKAKSSAASDKNLVGSNEVKDPEAKLSDSGSESIESDDDVHVREEVYLSKLDDNDNTIEMIQVGKMMDHTMRAYFMHSMEKIESLSAQLLRNECLSTKIYCDLDEKISMLCQRNSAQFQMLLEKLCCLQCTPSVSRQESLRGRKEDGNEFDIDNGSESNINKIKKLDEDISNKTPRNSLPSTRSQSRIEMDSRNSVQSTRSHSRNERDGRDSLQSTRSLPRNEMGGRDSLQSTRSSPRKEMGGRDSLQRSRSLSRNEMDGPTKDLSRSQSRILSAWSNRSEDYIKTEDILKAENFEKVPSMLLAEENLEAQCYSCHNKVQCLQKALDASIRELQESMKRLEEIKCKKDAETSWHGSLRSLRSKQNSVESDIPSNSKHRGTK